MIQPEKENLEKKLQQIKENSKKDFFESQQIFLENYETVVDTIFSQDTKGIKWLIKAYFEIQYVDIKTHKEDVDISDIFEKSIQKALQKLPLSTEKKAKLYHLLLQLQNCQKTKNELYHHSEQIFRDPYFPIIEDIIIDGALTREEFYALKFSYMQSWWDIKKSLYILSPQVRKSIMSAIENYQSLDTNISEKSFRNEYSEEILAIEKRWIQSSEVISFIARSYYKNPWRYKKYEHPKRRLKRTFKLALLGLLRKKLGNIDAENILRRFEEWESFYDFFEIIFEILEILSENPQDYEIYSITNALEDTEDLVSQAETTQQKILQWQKITTSISTLISETDSNLESSILEKILDENTDIIWENIHFRSEDEQAWIYAEWKKTQESDEKDDDEYVELSTRGAYEAIKDDFIKLENKKTKAFLEGRYDDIDIYNEKLFSMQKKLEKLALLLWEEL